MDIDSLFNHSFHKRHEAISKEISQMKIKKIDRFPSTQFIVNGDLFFKTLWRMIDESKDYFWITTYAVNSSPAADTTFLKLIEACKRGVHVVLFVDNVQYWAKPSLIKQFQNCGGRFLLLNPQWQRESIKGYMNGDVWRRHHEKLIVSDSWGLIGSANIEGSYGGIRYGSCQFKDLNYVTENIVLDQYRQHFADTADFYGFNLHTRYENESLLAKLNKQYPNSEFYPKGKYQLLHNNHVTKLYEIENSVINMLNKATKEIKVMQPYHYPISKFDRAMIHASKRGVPGVIITSGQRDQPVFKNIHNYRLFQRLIYSNIQIHQTKERLLHSKVYLTDGKYLNLGSMNNDRWSWFINTEVNLAIQDERDYDWVLNYFEMMKARGRPVTKDYTISASKAASIAFWQNFLYLSEILMSRRGKPEEAYLQNDVKVLEKDIPE